MLRIKINTVHVLVYEVWLCGSSYEYMIVVYEYMSRAKGVKRSGVTIELKIASKGKRASRSRRRCIILHKRGCFTCTGASELNQTQRATQKSVLYSYIEVNYSVLTRKVE